MRRRIVQFVLGLLLVAAAASGSDITGIWAGQQQGRRGEPEDIAFRFRLEGPALTGKLLGDEFDLPISEASLEGDRVRFTVITTNYYSGTKSRYIYSGSVRGREMELLRERVQTAEEKAAGRPALKQTIKLTRLD
jgi:hypothetical protein